MEKDDEQYILKILNTFKLFIFGEDIKKLIKSFEDFLKNK